MAQAVPFVKSFSGKERERRWQLVRDFLKQNELDALLVIGQRTGQSPDSFLSNWIPGNTVIFPLKGEPALLAYMNTRLIALTEAPEDARPWIKDIRAGARGSMIIAALKDKGLEKSHIGVLGLDATTSTGGEGWISYGTWRRIANRLPDCKFDDVTERWDEATFCRSEEELAHVRRTAHVLELATAEQVKVTRAGITELEVWAAVQKVLLDNGIQPARLIMRSGPNVISWGDPDWAYGVGTPRVLQPGDVVLTELFADSKGVATQAQGAVAIPPVSPEDAECARLARLSYEAGLRALKPGKTFEEVVTAMEEPLNLNAKDSKVWYLTPLIHSMNPQLCVCRTQVGMLERYPGASALSAIGISQIAPSRIRGGEIVLKPGMVFELEPNACIGKRRVNIGGTAIVTDGEPEELNEVPCQMRVAGKA
ncbi:MAG: aminopeptidase P family protein [Chloroflexi bacterium]|nr:aminopeptidase P family protein [Chloroflexota bacterium]